MILDTINSRFKRKRMKKYGNINKGFTEEELQKFFHFFHDSEDREFLAFKMQAFLGLRIGEVIKVRLHDINFDKRNIIIHSEKTQVHDELYLHDAIFPLLRDFVSKHKQEILDNANFVFFSRNSRGKKPFLSTPYLRKKFREICARAGLTEFYSFAEDQNNPHCCSSNRKLFRLTTHSLRHYYVTKVYNSTLDPVTTSRLARHTKLQTTQIYIHTDKASLNNGLKKTFESSD
ncbi:MAG: site-specific integrase [Candidatus Micrarchaeota archaeon]